MSCNNCGGSHNNRQCGEARLKIAVNDCSLCYSFDGVPGVAIPISSFSCCIAQPVFRLNTEKKQLEMDDNCYTATSGTKGQRYIVPVADIGKLISLQDLSNFCDYPLEKCGLAQVCLIDGKYQLCAKKPELFRTDEKFQLLGFHVKDGTECEECGEEDCSCYKLLPTPEDPDGCKNVLTESGWSPHSSLFVGMGYIDRRYTKNDLGIIIPADGEYHELDPAQFRLSLPRTFDPCCPVIFGNEWGFDVRGFVDATVTNLNAVLQVSGDGGTTWVNFAVPEAHALPNMPTRFRIEQTRSNYPSSGWSPNSTPLLVRFMVQGLGGGNITIEDTSYEFAQTFMKGSADLDGTPIEC